mmetsp:Transcript_46272/g.104494  ORF Transcript_46272/g.104494 Transcript_46272/m.104494 type:complete len:221 (-) Transcript_46272:36-698(-)
MDTACRSSRPSGDSVASTRSLESELTESVQAAETAGGLRIRRLSRWAVTGYSPGYVFTGIQSTSKCLGDLARMWGGGGTGGRSASKSRASSCFSLGNSSNTTWSGLRPYKSRTPRCAPAASSLFMVLTLPWAAAPCKAAMPSGATRFTSARSARSADATLRPDRRTPRCGSPCLASSKSRSDSSPSPMKGSSPPTPVLAAPDTPTPAAPKLPKPNWFERV